jgi:hypothetical protein
VLELKEELLKANEVGIRSGQRNTQARMLFDGMKRCAKIPDPPALSNAVSPTFDSRLIKMEHTCVATLIT